MLIEDYGLIGDLQTAALVGRNGSIDWLCFPRFDSGSCFAALLGTERNGRWLMTPDCAIERVERRYRERSLVHELDFHTEHGVVRVIDFMPPRGTDPDVVRHPFVLTWFPSHQEPPRAITPEHAYEDTCDFWDEWLTRCGYRGRYAEPVFRSLMTLKAMTYMPTGGLVAAPTTSLPERIGGVRNWDYRYCWLRDASFALTALVESGFVDEAGAWRAWLLRAVAGDPDDLQIMYGPGGERRLTELELPWLEGYEGSRPVRIGNNASRQFQLDVYGEVLDVLYQARRRGLPPDDTAWALCVRLLRNLEGRWHEPDEGIWEVRGPQRHFTHSKVMAWVAFDRGLRLIHELGRDGPGERWRAVRDEIHAEVLERGYDPELGSFVQSYDSKRVDARLPTIPLYGFLPPDDPRVRSTLEAVRSELGLLSEEYEPTLERLVGNFPQAFSHIGLVNTALRLDRALAQREAKRPISAP